MEKLGDSKQKNPQQKVVISKHCLWEGGGGLRLCGVYHPKLSLFLDFLDILCCKICRMIFIVVVQSGEGLFPSMGFFFLLQNTLLLYPLESCIPSSSRFLCTPLLDLLMQFFWTFSINIIHIEIYMCVYFFIFIKVGEKNRPQGVFL